MNRLQRWSALALVLALTVTLGLTLAGGAQAQEGERPFLGVRVDSQEEGARIVEVFPASPAAQAGLRVNDWIRAVDGQPVTAESPLPTLIRAHAPGDTVTLTLERRGETLEVTVTLGLFPTPTPQPTPLGPPIVITPGPSVTVVPIQPPLQAPFLNEFGQPRGYLGVRYTMLTPETREELDFEITVERGAVILEVQPGTPAGEVGLQPGDVVIGVNGEVVDAERTLGDRLYAYEAGDTVTLTVMRGEETLNLEVTLAQRPFGPQMMPLNPERMQEFMGRMREFMEQHPETGFFLDPSFDWDQFLEEHPEWQEFFRQFQDFDPQRFRRYLEERGLPLSDLRRLFTDPSFDWEQFLEEHPAFSQRMVEIGGLLTPEQWREMLPGFPWFGPQDPFHQGVDPHDAPDAPDHQA